MKQLFADSDRRPLYGLLVVQLLTGIILLPMNNFLGIYLNEALSFPIHRVAGVIALGQAAGMAASLLGGGLSDRWGKKRVLILGLAALTVCGSLYLIRVPWIVLVLWSIGGAGLGLSTLSSQGYLTSAAAPGTLGVFSALYNWGYTIGGAIGVPLAALIIGESNFSALGRALMGTGVFIVLFALILPRLHQPAGTDDGNSAAGGYRALFNRRIVMLICLRFLPTCYYGVLTLLPLLIKKQGGSNATVAWYAAGSSVLASITQLAAGRTADRLGVRIPTTAAFCVILAAIAGTIITSGSVWGLYAFGMLGVSAAWALSTLLPGLVKTAADPRIHGKVFGSLHLVWTAAMIGGTLLGGSLLEKHVWLPFVIVGILNCAALLITIPFFRSGSIDKFPVDARRTP